MCHILLTIYYSTINISAAHQNSYVESIPTHHIAQLCMYQQRNHIEGGVNDTTLLARVLLLLIFFVCSDYCLHVHVKPSTV